MILFLDFDGVLHPVSSRTEPKFCRMQLLEDWLQQRSIVDVVISSSWREVHPFNELVDLFANDLQGRVIGVTPQFHRIRSDEYAFGCTDARLLPHQREFEIRHWLQESWEPQRPWAALDDMPELFRPGCEQLVLCDGAVGLTAREFARLDALIVPLDFPSAIGEAALSGAQLKLVVSHHADGEVSVHGDAASERIDRYLQCIDILDGALASALKPEYAQLHFQRLREKIDGNLREDFSLPSAEAEWVLEQFERRLAMTGRLAGNG